MLLLDQSLSMNLSGDFFSGIFRQSRALTGHRANERDLFVCLAFDLCTYLNRVNGRASTIELEHSYVTGLRNKITSLPPGIMLGNRVLHRPLPRSNQ